MSWEDRLAYPNGTIGYSEKRGNTRQYQLVAEPVHHELVSGIQIDGLGYNKSLSGPLLVFEQGETVELQVINHLDEPTALHVHGLSKPNSQDGIPEIEPTPSIDPGHAYTYRFIAWQSGTFFYHSPKPEQIAKGLMGPFIVLPKNASDMPYLDYIMVLQQWQIDELEFGEVKEGLYKPSQFCRNANFFTLNGKSFPDTAPLYTRYGEKIRVRFINKSSGTHTMHIHGHDFNVKEVNAFPREQIFTDTIDVPSGYRKDIEVVSNNPVVFPINGTRIFHQTNNGQSPGGMVTRLIYLE